MFECVSSGTKLGANTEIHKDGLDSVRISSKWRASSCQAVWLSCVAFCDSKFVFLSLVFSFVVVVVVVATHKRKKIFLLQPNSKQSWRNHRRYSRRNRRICIRLHRIRATSLFVCLLACLPRGREVERRGRKGKESKAKQRKDDRMNAFFLAGGHLVEV